MKFKIGDVVRHVQEDNEWVWRITDNINFKGLYQVRLEKDVTSIHSGYTYPAGSTEYLSVDMTVLHPMFKKKTKQYQPDWL